MNYADSKGMFIIAPNPDTQKVIMSTLPKSAHPYVKFEKNGFLNVFSLMRYKNTENSLNFYKLLNIASSTRFVEVELSDSFCYISKIGIFGRLHMGLEPDLTEPDTPTSLTTGEWGHIGHMGLPGRYTSYNSTNGNVQVTVHKDLSEDGKAQSMAHELYGHTYFYIISGNAQINGHKTVLQKEINFVLGGFIIEAIKETFNNMHK